MRPAGVLVLAFSLLAAATARAQTPPTAAWQAYQAGQAALARENFVVAEKQFRTAIQEERRLSLAHYGLGTVLAATRRYPEALDAFKQAIAMHREWIALQAAEAGQIDQRREVEIQDLRDAIRAIEGGTLKQGSQKAIQLEQRIQQLEREKGREKMNVKGTVPPEFYVALGSAHHRLGHLDEARAAYEEALKLDPARGEAHSNLAAIALARGDKDGAREHVRLAEAAGFRVNPDLKRDATADSAAVPTTATPAQTASAPTAAPAAPVAEEPTLTIDHKPLTCAVVGRSPLLEARVQGVGGPAQVRVRFGSPDSPYRYGIRLRADGERFVTRLPQPQAGLASFNYSIDATDTAAASARTEEFTVQVTATAEECPGARAAASPTREASLLVEVPASAPARPPVPDGFSSEGVKGSGGTKVGMINVPARLGAAVGVVAAVTATVVARSSIYEPEEGPTAPVQPTQVDMIAIDPPPGSTLVAPGQQVRATFRVVLSRPADRLFLRVRMQDARGANCIEIGQVTGPVQPGQPVEMTAVGPANASLFCGTAFDVQGLGVDVQADHDFLVTNRFFPASYKVVRTTPGS